MPTQELILLAMNESPTLGLLERALHASNYDVAIALNKTAIEKALMETNPALLVIGDDLSGVDGFELARSNLERFPTLPVVFFASKEDPHQLKQALQAGMSDVLFPPLKIDEIVQSIKRSQKRAEKVGDWVRREIHRSTASLERRIDEMKTLVQLGGSISSSLDEDSVLTNVVTAAVELTGAEEGQLLLLDEETNELYMRAGRNFEESFSRTFRLPVQDTLAGQVLGTGSPVSFNDDAPNKIKTAYLVHALLYVPLRVNDKVIGVLGVDNRHNKRPFTEHHQLLLTVLADYAAIAIQNAQFFQHTETERVKLETTIANIQDGVILVDEESCILLINPVARRAFGMGSGDVTGQHLLEAIKNDDFAMMMETIRENPLQHNEITFEDGRVFNTQYMPIAEFGAVITLEDISHLKMLDRLKSDFIHTVSHDLRSPLTAIMGYVELLDRVGPLNDQQRAFIVHVQNSVHNITSLVNDLLDLGRIEAGFDAHKDNVSLSQIVRFTVDNLHQQMVEKKQALVLNIEDKTPDVLGNPIRLRQVVDNLVTNAIKYTPAGGTLTINLRTEDERSQLIFEVIDTGVGIPSADQPHIFEKFYRASNAPKGTPGTGLGLAIVKTIVESHLGRIWVDSTVGRGTKFVVVLPCAADAI